MSYQYCDFQMPLMPLNQPCVTLDIIKHGTIHRLITYRTTYSPEIIKEILLFFFDHRCPLNGCYSQNSDQMLSRLIMIIVEFNVTMYMTNQGSPYMPNHCLPNTIRFCGKLEMLDRLLPKLKATDHWVTRSLYSKMEDASSEMLVVNNKKVIFKDYRRGTIPAMMAIVGGNLLKGTNWFEELLKLCKGSPTWHDTSYDGDCGWQPLKRCNLQVPKDLVLMNTRNKLLANGPESTLICSGLSTNQSII
ncbi:Helicase, C-terminal [Artemisia annua]|uniref:Helicase, C-terminal n=1 Tax=Artemisia annua TaxID=35608 RepID=A0A2U1QI64_ARTAN|nr:Helicase, C-terminal [Artemisia annua]